MAITINGTGSISGISAGGLPDASVTANDLASNAVTTAKVADANITAAKLDGAQSGSAPIYGARAWVNFNGTSTVAIRASGNVSSITDNGTGDYTVNFTTAMPDANYCVKYTAAQIPQIDGQTRLTTGSVRVFSLARADGYTLFDNDSNHVAIFR